MTITIDDGELGEMEALVLEEKMHREKFEDAKKRVEQWQPRIELATKNGRHELAAQAQEQLSAARRDYGAARHALERVQMDKQMLRKQARRPDDRTAQEMRDEQALGAFRDMGADPETWEINQVAKEQSADDALAALKAKLKEE